MNAEFEEIAQSELKDIADEIHSRAYDLIADLINDDPVAALTANTNASGWYLDELDIPQDSIEISKDEIRCTAYATFAGDQDLDAGPAGTSVSGTLTVVLRSDMEIVLADQEFEIEDPFGDDD